ncbi:MAG: MATE family efflux transporter [Candidatus Coprenecus sp.]|nr:MATE family efflux transporter [Candidatus Coprenecus sp.]
MMSSTGAPVELGTEKVSKLLMQYSLPAIIAMTASSLYNMVDAIFIGQGVGPLAISGLAVTFPFMNLSTAFGTLVGVGASTIASMLLGQRNYTMARKVLGNVVVLNGIIGMLFTVISLIFIDPILYFFGASENTLPYAKQYMEIILLANVITHIYFGLNSLLRSSGHPKMAMAATILTVVLNAILDPLFIFVLNMGIRGAAIATVIAQCVSLVWLVILFSNKREVIHFGKGVFKLDKRIVKDSFIIGMAPFLMNFVSCFVVIFINMRLKEFGGDLAIGAYGIVNRIVFVFIMIVMGFTQGMQPIVGYNYGARNIPRVFKALKYTMVNATLVMTFGFFLCEIFPSAVVSLFTTDPTLSEISVAGLRKIVLAFPLVASSMVIGHFFQSIGKPKRAIFLSLSRQLIYLIPCMWIIPGIIGIKGVWYSFPISDMLASITAFILILQFINHYRKTNEL